MTRIPAQGFVEHMLSHTVRLVHNAAHFPSGSGMASGLLVCRSPRPLLVTAGHIFHDDEPWTLETNVTSAAGTLHLAIHDLQRLASFDLRPGTLSEIDLAWAWIDPEDASRGLRDAQAPHASVELLCYQGPLDERPAPDRVYGFAAWNRVWFHEDLKTLEAEASYESGLQLKGARDDGVYVFALARKHQGHAYYQGASGAPVADEEGRIVGLLLGGSEGNDELYVAPIARYSPFFDREEASSHHD